MKNIINWIKTNPITVASILVVLVSLGCLLWIHSKGSALEERMAERQRTLNAINGLLRHTVSLPASDPNEPPIQKTITVNEPAIQQLATTYNLMGEEYKRVVNRAREINRAGHITLVDGLFPQSTNPVLPYEAKEAYKLAFQVMLQDREPTREAAAIPRLAEVLPRLDAGLPPDGQVIAAEVARVETEMTATPGVRSARQLTATEQQQLEEEKAIRAIELLRNRAESLHIYADTDPASPTFPFDIKAWANQTEPPKLWQLWEGQLELWIQQDIAAAIAAANGVGDPGTNVLTAPVKRLLSIEVVPGYVGLHSLGGVGQPASNRGRENTVTLYSAPARGETGSPDQRAPDNFYVGPTGRVSNALYDVRHARLSIIADFQQLPALFEALSKTNFMTVLQTKLTDVDEYAALDEGFVYGTGDAVQVDMVVESIWLRDWTEPLMPSLTRQYVGIDPATDVPQATGQQQGPGMFGPEMFPGMYGPYGSPYGSPYGPGAPGAPAGQ